MNIERNELTVYVQLLNNFKKKSIQYEGCTDL